MRKPSAKLQRDQPDVVLLDMVMPGPDGLETLRRIRETRPTTKVVMLSCVRDTRKVAMAMRLGAHDYLSKPVQKEEMDDVLRFCLDNPAPSAPGVGEVIEVVQGVYFFAATAANEADTRSGPPGRALRFPGFDSR